MTTLTQTTAADRSTAPLAPTPASATWFSFVRTPLLLAGTIVAGLMLALAGMPWQGATNLSVATFTLVNIVCWWLLVRRLRAEARTLGDLVGRFHRVDLLWGLLWTTVLFVPFYAIVFAGGALMKGSFAAAFEVFAPDVMLPDNAVILGILTVSALVFPFLNAPLEELYYRGYAQTTLENAGRRTAAIWIPTVGFAIQHAFVALSLASLPGYLVAFLVWGLIAAVIRRRQGRLWPLVIAHLVTNFSFAAMPFVMLFAR